MDITATTTTSARFVVPRGLAPASFVLGGTLLSLIGLTWDIQWHSDVGPDTFFTMPHLFLYAGSAFSGIASLVVVLMTTANAKRSRTVDPIVGGRAVGVFGRTFAAPVGYLISGTGAALFLVYGLWDQWWHGLYGFDAVIDSPPHIGLLLSISITMVGAVMIFAVARDQRWGTYGVIGTAAVLLVFSMVTVLGLRALPGGLVNPVSVGTAFFSVMILFMAAGALNRRGGALAVGVSVAVLQAVFWWFSPWAARVYADASGLPLRDYTDGIPGLPNMIPMCLVIVAVAVELLHRVPAWIPGALGGAIIAACVPLQRVLVYGAPFPVNARYFATIVLAAAFAAGAATLGRRFGQMLRHLAPAKEARHA
ncbi:hypothetical protein SK803_24185 [Lentzea sp. BCCO 10_0856]|uniref:ABC-2 type transport system permease protein n=1 Tax=Lentzea miocenica TaxID=3095431 RepID=A0ABU4T587_9PSEU|nr:hypothetical protein [Lentzea sp. BCCO 10_0856]MDX8033329.1 hypothetical protein [Lentzea sp. BCCO 10_0856]